MGTQLKTHLPAALEVHSKSPAAVEAHKAAFAAAVAPAMEKAVKSSTDKVLAGLKPALQDAFKASFQASIIPAFEKSCQNMFSQIHGTFERGQAERVESAQAQLAAVASMQTLQKTADALAPKLLALSSAAEAASASPGPTPVNGAQPPAPAAEPQVCMCCARPGGGADCV